MRVKRPIERAFCTPAQALLLQARLKRYEAEGADPSEFRPTYHAVLSPDGKQVEFWCPVCGQEHRHGFTEPVTHRDAHCISGPDGSVPIIADYYLDSSRHPQGGGASRTRSYNSAALVRHLDFAWSAIDREQEAEARREIVKFAAVEEDRITAALCSGDAVYVMGYCDTPVCPVAPITFWMTEHNFSTAAALVDWGPVCPMCWEKLRGYRVLTKVDYDAIQEQIRATETVHTVNVQMGDQSSAKPRRFISSKDIKE